MYFKDKSKFSSSLIFFSFFTYYINYIYNQYNYQYLYKYFQYYHSCFYVHKFLIIFSIFIILKYHAMNILLSINFRILIKTYVGSQGLLYFVFSFPVCVDFKGQPREDVSPSPRSYRNHSRRKESKFNTNSCFD